MLGTDHKLREAVATFHTHAAPIPPKPQIAAVVLGDSFSSGEGGRWSGNGDLVQRSADPTLGGTDRAGHVDLKFIYEAKSVDNLCHRSTAAPVTYLRDLRFQDRFDRVFNLACSGARVKNLWPASEGGEAFRGEAPQITQLGQLAAQHDIKLIVVGIGGNDMGFSDVIRGVRDGVGHQAHDVRRTRRAASARSRATCCAGSTRCGRRSRARSS